MRIDNKQRAEVLIEALPHIRKYSGKILLVKYGGSAMTDEGLKRAVMGDLVLLSLIGVKVVLVHGGGPEITEMLTKLGKKTEFVDGLRVTDAETADVVQMVLAGKVNKGLVNLIQSLGGRAIGLSGADGGLIRAKQMDARLGFVGEIESLNVKPVHGYAGNGLYPRHLFVGCDAEGNVYNINADTAAAKIAGMLKAESFINLTDNPGLLEDENDESTLIGKIFVSEAQRMDQSGSALGRDDPQGELLCGSHPPRGEEGVHHRRQGAALHPHRDSHRRRYGHDVRVG